MGALSFFKSLYHLDTLDTRFTNSSSTPYKTVVESRGDATASKERAARFSGTTSPSRWKTPEFILYYVLLSIIIPSMFWTAYNASKPSNPQYKRFEPYLAPGWIPGRKIDLSDAQYYTFRKNIPAMSALLLFHPLLRRLYNAVIHPVASNARSSRPTLEEAESRLKQRTSYDFGFAILFLLALHGVSAFKILIILYINYQVATNTPRKSIPAATWIFNIGILFANEMFTGYKLANMAMFVSRSVGGDLVAQKSALVSWAEWLDSYGGIMSRWQILFNITVLRLISFNMDYYWSLDRRSYSPVEKKQVDPASLSERDRITIPAQAKDFSFQNFVAYAIYAPLYLTGPILTFNDYISQQRYRPATVETSRTIRYGIRFVLTLLVMEVVLHYDYVQAISKANPSWGEYSAAQLSVLSYFNLILIWLKLLLPWRLFRLWSLVDGIDPPENMLRCVSNNYSTLAFWRSWHRSYNRWLTRYIYIPLGGSSFANPKSIIRSIFNYILTFTFVALWHDIKLRLLIWGWLIVVFMLPEMTARALFPARKWENNPTTYRMLSCAGAVINVFMMMMANLVGYAVGIDGLQAIISGIVKDVSGWAFLLTACASLFMAIQLMFEQREAELRRGLALKC
ncbi:MBOAT, membrane-bound O-acyltransferase family-domain-containing protein [Pestalotiopsis sp. NC0098]|nr:MBOAT, membrane-bound O-acyltransferase family-domain-containing protein [Pestalotiopsis sp. NC0098]